MKYTVLPGHSVPDWFDAAFAAAVSQKVVISAAAIAAAALKKADSADAGVVDTTSADIAYSLWVTASNHKDVAMHVLMAAVAIAADVDIAAAIAAFKAVKIDMGDNA